VQGGSAFVAREPVMLPEETRPAGHLGHWSRRPSTATSSIQVVGLDEAAARLAIAVRAEDVPDGATIPVFYGDAVPVLA
jgi:hypothetical protein